MIYTIIIILIFIILLYTFNFKETFYQNDKDLMDDHTTHDKSIWQGGCVGSIFYPGDRPCPEETPYYWNPANNKIGICCNIYPKGKKSSKKKNCRNNIRTSNRSGPDYHSAGYGCVNGEHRIFTCEENEIEMKESIPNNFPGVCCMKKEVITNEDLLKQT